MQEKLQTIKDKPQHVRENIALGISGGITLLVFLGWGASLANSHTFAITSPIPNTPDVASPLAKAGETKQSVSNLLGAVGAVASGSSTEPKIQIVDSPTPSSAPAPEQTVIHF
jgi:hypothetical protein